MTKSDELMNLAPVIYDSVMTICEDTMEDDNELERVARKVQLLSMGRCDKCDNIFDTDLDPDSTYFDMRFICESCRENLTPQEHAEHERILNE